MDTFFTLAQESFISKFPFGGMGVIGSIVLLALVITAMLIKQYKRCPSNRILVIYGKGTGTAARCIHGGGVFVIPLFQSWAFLSLEPITIDIDLTSALSKKNIRVNVPSTFTIGVSTEPSTVNNAAERLLELNNNEIAGQAQDIIVGQMRLVIATLTIEQINQDRETFLDLVNKNVGAELAKIGLDVINVNIRDITDESGYIDAIGRKAASEAINQAKVEVAQANREGAIGQATADRDKEVKVAEQMSESTSGQKEAERNQRIRVAKYEAEGITGEANAQREQEVAIAQQKAVAVQGKKMAEAEQRIKVAEYEAQATEGENTSKAQIAEYNATLEERQADSQRRGEVALANARRDILAAQKEQELAKLEKEQIAQQMIERKKVEIDAEADAERIRRVARGEADAILAKYEAEAKGVQAVLEAKAKGYENLLKMCGEDLHIAPTLLMVEKMPELVATQVKAIQNLKIDKITVWDSGNNSEGESSTSNFLRSLIGSLPPMHELAEQAGIDLPGVLGSVDSNRLSKVTAKKTKAADNQPQATPPKPAADGER